MRTPFGPIAAVVLTAFLLPTRSQAQIAVPVATTPKSLAPVIEGWPGYGRDSSHSAMWSVPSQNLQPRRWSTPADLNPQYSGPNLLIHYGSPLVTPIGIVSGTVKTGARALGKRVDDGDLHLVRRCGADAVDVALVRRDSLRL